MNFSRSTTGSEGLALLGEVRALKPTLPVVLITAWGSIALAVEGMKAGAADFITKPWSNAQLLQSVRTAIHLRAAREDAPGELPARAELDLRFDFGAIAGKAPKLVRVLELVGRVAPTDASVLITGESGTGKELVAEAIHRNSRRRNAGRESESADLHALREQMFGHVRGAFTDARAPPRALRGPTPGRSSRRDRRSRSERQVKLLRVLQDRSYEVLGSSHTRTVDVRVVSATNRDLGEMVAAGQFREDLLYRLNLISIRLPALRERAEDIPLLARHFLDAAARVHARPGLSLTPRAEEWLSRFRWPGNVRQLEQTIERAVLVVDGDRLDAEHFRALADLEAADARDPSLPFPGEMTLDEIERRMIVKCLAHYGGNITRAAEALGLSRTALYRRIQKHGLEG
jgi:DNA-binding NtrC family response regulator